MYFVYIWYEVFQQCLLAFYDMDYMLSVKYAYCVFRTKGVVKLWLKHLWMVLECVHYTFDFRISFWSLHIQKPFTVARFLCGVGADSLTGCGLWNMEIYLQVNLGLVKIHRWQSSAWQLDITESLIMVTDAENCVLNYLWLDNFTTISITKLNWYLRVGNETLKKLCKVIWFSKVQN